MYFMDAIAARTRVNIENGTAPVYSPASLQHRPFFR